MKNQKNQMTLTLCLEDNTGKDTNLEVRPDDDFESFLQKAKKILGYLPKLSDITEGKSVSLKDNIYKFLIEAEMKKDSGENADAKNDDLEEFAEIEYLSEEEEIEHVVPENRPQIPLAEKKAPKTEDSEEFTQMEYLEDDSEDPDIVDLEVLESSLEEDELGHSLPKKKRRLDNEEDDDIADYINNTHVSPKESNKKIYTTKELLNVLGNSSESESEEGKFKDKNGDNLNGQFSNKFKIKNKMGSKFANEKQREIDKKLTNLKDIKKSTFYARRQLEKRFANSARKTADVEAGFKMSSFDMAMLKRNVRPSSDRNKKASKEEDDQDGFSSSVNLEDSRYLPSNYEDVDNEGVYDYMEDLYGKVDVNDLLTERKAVDFVKKDTRDDIARAVGGMNRAMGIDRKFSTPPVMKRPRGRPRKNAPPVEYVQQENVLYDSHSSYLESVVKYEPIDVEDEDYVPGKDIDWMKKKKDKYNCRMCFNNFPSLTMAISHALTHRVPHKSVFPCILCAYGFTTYTELQKHMKSDHRKKRVFKKTGVVQPTKPRVPKPKKEPKPQLAPIKLEIMDDEEVCDVEMLEEWLEEDVDVDESYSMETEISNEMLQSKSNIKKELNDSYESKTENIDFFESGDDEEWLMDEADDDTSFDDNIRSVTDDMGMKRKRRPKNTKPKCRTCLHRFENENDVLEHKCPGPKEKLRGTRGSHRCALCGQTFPSRRRLIYHRSFHQVELLEWKLVCKHCPTRKFLTEADLFDHINNEHNVDFVCDEPGCSKQFHLRTALRAHARTHGKKTYQCQECGKQFHDIHNLKEHNITHLAVKPFQCHICLKFLNRRSRLRMHLLAHESCPVENCVLSCKHCKMAFKDAADAESHVKESEDCFKNILSDDSSDLIAELENLHEDQDDKSLIEDIKNETIKMISENIGAETSVDEIVNETLAKTGIVSLPVDSMIKHEDTGVNPEEISNEDHLKALLAEVDVADDKLTVMLTQDGILESEVNNECKESISKDTAAVDNINELLHASNIKDLLENVGSTLGSEENESLTDQIAVTDLEKSIDDGNESQGNDRDNSDFSNSGKSIRNTRIYTEEELLSQLTDETKKLITAVKIKVVYRCEYCEKTFCSKDALNTHRKVHDGLRNPFICNICNAAFSTFARCTSHKTTHGFYKLITDDEKEKGSHEVSGYENFPVIKYFLCQSCPKTFLHWTYLQVHKRHKHGESTYYFNCKVCGEKFTDSWLLNSHRRKVHAEVVNCKKSANTSYKCADCGQGYNKRIQLAKHRQEVHNDYSLMALKNKPGPFACTLCDKMYHTKVGLDGHMRSHNGDIYICDLCGNSFAHRAGLETHHKRVHLREQRYICRTCGQNFFTPADLDIHRRCHTGEKPFPCDFCHMSFRTKGRRNEHHRTHTGERPFPCDICGMAFRRSNAMKNHRLIHTGERRHTCPYCPKLFHVYANLKSHVKAKHPGQCVILQFESDQIEESLKMFAESDNDVVTTEDITNDPSKMLVLEDVIIEENDGDNIIRADDSANMLEYTYEADIDAHVQGDEISVNPVEYVDTKDNKVQIQLLEATDHGQGLLYAVEDATDLIQGEVHYTLVDDLGDDTKQQFSIISSDPFVKEEKDPIYYNS